MTRPLLAYPLCAVVFIGALGLALTLTRLRRSGQVILAIVLFSLWLAATPIFENWLTFHLKSQFPPKPVETLPTSEAVIVLGGIIGQPVPPRVTPDLSDTTDRIIEALRIYRAGKARFIIIAAGNLPGDEKIAPEAQLIGDFLVELGAPRSALVLETKSTNTRENAVNTAAIFKQRGWQDGLLVTSGIHMPRAIAAFEKVGLHVVPATTDVHAGPLRRVNVVDFFPDVGALARTTSAMKEVLGLWVYRYRGWA